MFFGIVFFVFFLAALPASVMVLAGTRSVFSALHPMLLIGLIARLGWTYWCLYGCLILLNGSSSLVVALLWDKVPEAVLMAAWAFSSFYFMVIMYSLMGYVLYQHHDKLGYAPDAETGEDDADLALYKRFLAEGRYDAAREELRGILQSTPDNLELHRQFHRLCKLTGDKSSLRGHGNHFIPKLVAQERIREAVETYVSCKQLDPDFQLNEPSVYLPLARLLRDRRAFHEAIQLINGFHKRFPKHPSTPSLYLLAAQIFHTELSEPQRAEAILKFVQKYFPGNPEAASIAHYLHILETAPG
ncbi:hypothetical protein CAI21_03790 [Alkalilimnicola ehrlichii]|uniref:Tetratricopeptide repeat protein n=1 Tax=Alkalilimnicola ehrlichii TaxID=351052 RepID=A0A3E0X1B9_9GAMM|nr:hypothetical protein CAI21_03790 [Alkalilimnicola ehrlichii]RFA38229.1 hypothetical protein CAL65_05150 [Alkalilimnicola ehrlichii]